MYAFFCIFLAMFPPTFGMSPTYEDETTALVGLKYWMLSWQLQNSIVLTPCLSKNGESVGKCWSFPPLKNIG